MLQNYNRYNVLKVFLDRPTEELRLREISRLSELSPPSVMNYLKEFISQGMIERYEKRGKPFYKAERDNNDFKFYKKIGILFELHNSGLIEFIWKKLSPEAIILYGSHSKGDAIEDSDIDLFIIGKEEKIDIGKFEEKLEKNIRIMFKKDIKKIPKELKNNLINGFILKGYLKIK